MLEQVAALTQEARTKSPLFSIICNSEQDKYRTNGLTQLSSICSAAVLKAKSNEPCLTLKELDGVRARFKELLDLANAHLQEAMNDPRLRMRITMLTSELGKVPGVTLPNMAALLGGGGNQQQQPGQQAQAQQQQQQSQTPVQQPPRPAPLSAGGISAGGTNMMSPEVLNNLIKRPLKQEDLKPPPLPKAKRQQSKTVAPSPRDEKTPKTPATTTATPAAESSTPASTSGPSGPKKRKASTATPKVTKKAKAGEVKAESSPAVATPIPLAPASDAPPPAATQGFTGNALGISRSTHADYFAHQQKLAESERNGATSFFTARNRVTSFDGDLASALTMWTDAQSSESIGGTLPNQSEDALADQSWHDFINEQSFDGDEPTPLLTRCRSLDTDPDCSPREDMVGRSPLATFVATAQEKRRLPLMSPSAQPYNGMLFVDAEDDFL